MDDADVQMRTRRRVRVDERCVSTVLPPLTNLLPTPSAVDSADTATHFVGNMDQSDSPIVYPYNKSTSSPSLHLLIKNASASSFRIPSAPQPQGGWLQECRTDESQVTL